MQAKRQCGLRSGAGSKTDFGCSACCRCCRLLGAPVPVRGCGGEIERSRRTAGGSPVCQVPGSKYNSGSGRIRLRSTSLSVDS
eukprot:4153707-Amphidinium_carterae.1